MTPGGGEELLDLEKSLGGEGKRGVNETVVGREDIPLDKRTTESREGILVVQTFEMSGR